MESGVAISFCWAVYQCNLFSDLIHVEWSAFSTLSVACLVDISIAGSMCYRLATSRTGFAKTDSFITKLMAYSLNSGLITSICSLAVGIICAIMPRNFIFLAFEILSAKLYINAYLALLNARYYLGPGHENRGSSEQADDRGVQIKLAPFSERTRVSKDDMSVEEGLTTSSPPDAVKPLSVSLGTPIPSVSDK
ncbi:hypothetical protein BJ138DRAFT_943884 [Hygrophoropsis aurantiaca]|uniref:Uncharacterized protein n=1 Tax=Hygrophoropsis aurantiaca TaxID=72124 RepID=A0ACB8AFG4_9AGAM|nr:hypothetical protein BJ138DRAFT_943884 [Hygrophoropsis aurantiaca]